MKITRVEAMSSRRDYSAEIHPAWSPGTIWIGATTTIYKVHTDEGIVGLGASGGSPQLTQELVAPKLVDQDPFNVEYLTRVVRNTAGGYASLPIACGIELALWDLIGKAAGLPLYRMWGSHRNRVRAYASMVEVGTPESRAEHALELLDRGYTAIKLRLHARTMKEDIAQVEAVREAVGDRMEIMVDANQAQEPGTPGSENDLVWGIDRAIATCRELADLDVTWLEEPLGRYEIDNLSRLVEASDVPIAGGENNIGLHEFRWLVDQRCYDIVQPDALVAGGLSVLRKVAAYAEMRHMQIAPHHGGNGLGVAGHLHLIASIPNAEYIELIQEPGKLDTRDFQGIVAEPLVPDADGYVTVPDRPGLGVDLREDL
ncbi:MAG TPA: mandelate racemase/muconate lactonizing enzyme family protein [Thermomicrobiales bacterium]|nr:mandelate racemase/muconate lactonizing enzyme family protein [Thermomicrobiales bacterium]